MFLAIWMLASATAVDPLDVTGVWYPGDEDSQVEIVTEGDSVSGRLINYDGLEFGPHYDSENPDEELRSRTILGLPIISGFQRAKTKWRRGDIYDPNEGKTYRSAIFLKDSDTLGVQGCIALFCQTQEWKRVPAESIIRFEPQADEAPAQEAAEQ